MGSRRLSLFSMVFFLGMFSNSESEFCGVKKVTAATERLVTRNYTGD